MSQDNAKMEKRGFSEVNDGEFLPRSKELYIYFMGYLSIGFANRLVSYLESVFWRCLVIMRRFLNGASFG